MKSVIIMDILLDTSVLLDFMLPYRQKHERAKILINFLSENNHTLYTPSHAWFEAVSAINCEARINPKDLASVKIYRGNKKINIIQISIDKKFTDNHLSLPLPNLKSADMIYAVIAIKDKMILLTEDKKLLKEVNKLGGKALNIESAISEFINSVS